jgi:acyl-CoA thioester hydrolase
MRVGHAGAGMSSERRVPPLRSAFARFRPIQTRWMDNDVYGHVNNVHYYSYFDTAVNGHLIEAGALDIHGGDVIGFVVHTQCHYFEPLSFPQAIEAGLSVVHVGRSSVRYAVGLFAQGAASAAAAGEFVHVYVHRGSRRPVTALPGALSAALVPLLPQPLSPGSP